MRRIPWRCQQHHGDVPRGRHRGASGKLIEAATALYTPQITEASLAGTGFTLADYDDDVTEVWPENFEVFQLFATLQTQWRTGISGPSGLDYNTLFSLMAMQHLSDERQCEILDDIRVMESAALTEIHRKRD